MKLINKTQDATLYELISFPLGFFVGILTGMIVTLIIKEGECLA